MGMKVHRVILPCKICNAVGVVHKVAESDLDLDRMEPKSAWQRKACYGCRDLIKRDGVFRHGFPMLATIESFEDTIRDAIAATQLRIYEEIEVYAFEEALKMARKVCELGLHEVKEDHPVCVSCRKQDFLCSFSEGTEAKVTARREVNEGVKSLVVNAQLEPWETSKQFLRQRKRWHKYLAPAGLGLWGKHKNRDRDVNITVYGDPGASDPEPILRALVKMGVLGVYRVLGMQHLDDEEVNGSLVVITVKESP